MAASIWYITNPDNLPDPDGVIDAGELWTAHGTAPQAGPGQSAPVATLEFWRSSDGGASWTVSRYLVVGNGGGWRHTFNATSPTPQPNPFEPEANTDRLVLRGYIPPDPTPAQMDTPVYHSISIRFVEDEEEED